MITLITGFIKSYKLATSLAKNYIKYIESIDMIGHLYFVQMLCKNVIVKYDVSKTNAGKRGSLHK